MSQKRRPKAYSYIRWSSPQQAAGDSSRRQIARAESYAQKHNLYLVDDKKWEDRGTSAFRGLNWHEGALGAFVKAIDDGDIPRGSYLLVEAMDRISRDDTLTAVNKLAELTQRDITVVTLMDGQEWDKAALKKPANLYYLIALFSTANFESKNKQDRSRAYWAEKRNDLPPRLVPAVSLDCLSSGE